MAQRYRVLPNSCWEWFGGVNSAGYGPHKRFYERFAGPVPPGLELDHLCRNKLCVNPEHLEPVTHLENIRRGEKANRTHCVRGHSLDLLNTYIKPNGSRNCRTCRRNALRALRQRRSNGY